MNAKQIHRIRAALAFGLRANGASFADIALVLKAGSKEKARALFARGRHDFEHNEPPLGRLLVDIPSK